VSNTKCHLYLIPRGCFVIASLACAILEQMLVDFKKIYDLHEKVFFLFWINPVDLIPDLLLLSCASL